MFQDTTYLLLIGALVLPVVGALLLRALSARLGTPAMYAGALLIFVAAAGCTLVLARMETAELRIGQLTLIQPLSIDLHVGEIPPPDEVALENERPVIPSPAAPTLQPSATPRPSATARPTVEPTATVESTPTTEPTSTAEPTATPEPTQAPEPEPEDEGGQQIYVVQPGDTIRAIAEDHGVSVDEILAANDMTAEEADQIQPDQELIIP